MRKSKALRLLLIALSLIAFSGVAYADAVPDTTFRYVIKKESKGQAQGEPTRVIKLVRVASAEPNCTTYASGDAVIYSINSADGVTITYATQSADGAIAGILATSIQTSDSNATTIATDDAGRRNWGWVIVHGPATARAKNGSTNGNISGDLFITSRDPSFVCTLEGTRLSGDGTIANDTLYDTRALKNTANGGGFFMADQGTATRPTVFVKAE